MNWTGHSFRNLPAYSWLLAKPAAFAASLLLPILSLIVGVAAFFRPPDPPDPLPMLVCVTDGMPDLAVVCSIKGSRDYRTGQINFGDGRDPEEFALDAPLRRNWFQDIWHRYRPETSELTTPLKEVFRASYEEAGRYVIKLSLRGEAPRKGYASTYSFIDVKESDRISGGSLVIKNLLLEMKDRNRQISSVIYLISQGQYENRIFLDTTRRYTRTYRAMDGWAFFNSRCQFVGEIDSELASFKRRNPFSYNPDRTFQCL